MISPGEIELRDIPKPEKLESGEGQKRAL